MANRVIIVFGLPGSGKSYFASRLAKKLEARYLNSDEIRMQMLQNRSYSQQEKIKVYDRMKNDMQTALAAGQDVVLDATFYKKKWREPFVQAAKCPVRFIEIRADDDIVKERLAKKRAVSEADYNVHLKVKAAFEPLAEPHLVLTSGQDNIDKMLNEALEYLKI